MFLKENQSLLLKSKAETIHFCICRRNDSKKKSFPWFSKTEFVWDTDTRKWYKNQEKDTTQKSPGYPTGLIVLLYPICKVSEIEFKALTVLKTLTLKQKEFEGISHYKDIL